MRKTIIVALLFLTACRYFPVSPAKTVDDVKKESGQSK